MYLNVLFFVLAHLQAADRQQDGIDIRSIGKDSNANDEDVLELKVRAVLILLRH